MDDKIKKLKEMLEVQGADGTWNYNEYQHGMYNGMAFAISVLTDTEPEYRDPPESWLSDD